jgi:hypothetical protein
LLIKCDIGAADLLVTTKITLQIAAVDIPPQRSAFSRCALLTRREGVIYDLDTGSFSKEAECNSSRLLLLRREESSGL